MNATKKMIFALLILALAVTTGCTTYQAQGGMTGGAMGGLAGAVLDRKNPWRGGVVGAVLGSLAGATISEVSVQGAREAVRAGQPVEYRTERTAPEAVYRAEPVYQEPANAQTRCRKVRERVYEGDRLIKDSIKEVCEGERTDRSY
ncbi:MAG TPA: glycine zipper 2TM domain-containing protein [Desulfurivibrionaceae bacterium]|nr:glycine zipper 2TM domain-containing protein [Desulfurivibrionaceae bacterium]